MPCRTVMQMRRKGGGAVRKIHRSVGRETERVGVGKGGGQERWTVPWFLSPEASELAGSAGALGTGTRVWVGWKPAMKERERGGSECEAHHLRVAKLRLLALTVSKAWMLPGEEAGEG